MDSKLREHNLQYIFLLDLVFVLRSVCRGSASLLKRMSIPSLPPNSVSKSSWKDIFSSLGEDEDDETIFTLELSLSLKNFCSIPSKRSSLTVFFDILVSRDRVDMTLCNKY